MLGVWGSCVGHLAWYNCYIPTNQPQVVSQRQNFFRIKIGKILRSFLAKCQITLLKNDTILLVGMIPKLVIRQQILRFFVGWPG